MRDPADKTAREVLTETGIYDVFGLYRTPVHDGAKLRRFEAGVEALIAREGFDESDPFVKELRSLLSERIIAAEMEDDWRLL
jgi:hypothetical protein